MGSEILRYAQDDRAAPSCRALARREGSPMVSPRRPTQAHSRLGLMRITADLSALMRLSCFITHQVVFVQPVLCRQEISLV
jgi:hypothetical protein